MPINKKLIHFKTKENFLSSNGTNGATTPTNGNYGNIPETSIVFIKDTQEIWTHGLIYGEQLKEVTWSELKALRDWVDPQNANNKGKLIPGLWYRITDYTCTTMQEDTQSAGHVFDIIVRADDKTFLNENAYAAHHAGDTYFANSKLEAWELKYCLDNINWSLAPSTTAKTNYSGVKTLTLQGEVTKYGQTYYSWKSNEVITYGYTTTVYTLTKSSGAKVFVDVGSMNDIGSTLYDVVEDTSQGKGTITYLKDEYKNECFYDFKNIMFKPGAKTSAGTVANVFYYTFSFASGINDSTIKDLTITSKNCIGNKICSNQNQLPVIVFRNTASDSNCSYNIFGNYYCNYNTFGNNCQYNTFGNYCNYNTFGNYCQYNIFGNSCNYNTFGNNCNSHIFGNNCANIKLGTSLETKNYCRYIIVESGNQYLYLNCSATTSSFVYFQNVKIAQGVNNTSTYKTITHATAGDTFQTVYQPANSQVILV